MTAALTAPLAVALQTAACVGFGLAALRLTGLLAGLSLGERLAWGFALGMGVLGWLGFWTGIAGGFAAGPFAAVLAVGVLANGAAWGVPLPAREQGAVTPWQWLLLAALAAALAGDLAEGLAPPTDTDSLAYHFDLPKRFLMAGEVFFVPRAVDGAVPLLTHMTYGAALALGGERGLTLWAMVSGWAAPALVYAACARHAGRTWGLAAALLFLTTPAVVYGAGSGQVEARNAAYALAAALAVALARRDGATGAAVAAGLAAGFFAASKYTGLLFVLAAGLVLVAQRRWFSHGLAFGLGALAAGGQWYLWNFAHTGDPVFPMLYGVLPYATPDLWDPGHAATFRAMMLREEVVLPSSPLWMVAYPFVATLFSGAYPILESGRTGLGPFVLLALPFAALALWRFRRRLVGHPLFTVGAVAAVFYAVWFLMGSPQRVRHLVPVYPLLLVCVTAAAARWAAAAGATRVLGAAVAVTLGLQLAGQGLFTLGPLRRLIHGEGRDTYLARMVPNYDLVPWINAHLGPGDRIALTGRSQNYLIDAPIFYLHYADEARVDTRFEADDPARFLRQLRAQGITHLWVSGLASGETTGGQVGFAMWRTLAQWGCLEEVHAAESRGVASRTLPTLRDKPRTIDRVMRLRGPDCLPAGKSSTD